jgi:hypothetical protein
MQRAVTSSAREVIVGAGQTWVGPLTAGSSNGWVLTDVGTGSSTVAISNAGQLVFTGGTTDEDNSGLQYTTMLSPFRYSATLDIACFARVKLSTAITTDFMFGLFGIDTSPISASAIAVDDGIGFFKAATATDLTCHVRKNTTSTGSTALGITIVLDTFFLCGFTVKSGVCTFYGASDPNDMFLTNNALLGSGVRVAATTAPDDIDIVPTFLVGQEGGTTARVLTIDWAFFTQAV